MPPRCMHRGGYKHLKYYGVLGIKCPKSKGVLFRATINGLDF